MNRVSSLLLVVVPLIASFAVALDETPHEWLTRAESSTFRATSSYQQTIEYLERVASHSPFIRLGFFGHSAARRPLPLVIVSTEGSFTPASARASGKPILLIQSCIHAGEVDGKDATLMLLRDIAIGRLPPPEKATVLFVPILNPDGHERVSPFNRPNQDGPVEGMGFRSTSNGLNLNRDHMRLASTEMRALVRLFNEWRPHLHVDNHVTNGSDHGWTLTWAVAEAPQLAAGIDAWVQAQLPKTLDATRNHGHPAGPYVSLRDGSDPSQGFSSLPSGPRYSTNYFPLRHTPSILVEMHAHKPFRDRVLANHSFLAALIDEASRTGDTLVQAVTKARASTAALGRQGAEPSDLVLRWTVSDAHELVLFPVTDWHLATSLVTGKPILRYRHGSTREIEAPWYHTVEPEVSLARPRGYIVAPGWPQIEGLLADHDLVVELLTRPVTLEVETIRVAEPTLAGRVYQGTVMVEGFHVDRAVERRELPAGSLWVPADQTDFEVAAQLFEPEAPDSMLRWGLLSSVFERKEYIDVRTLEGLATRLIDDAELRAAWEAALEDEAFASDTGARYLWWYRRTDHWDEQVGLLPVMRVMSVPEMQTAPWKKGPLLPER